MNDSRLKKISFLSGKGGSGKTTVAISVGKLLVDMGLSVVLIDYDLSTNGASYFFKHFFSHDSNGIWETILGIEEITGFDVNFITIKEGFYFIPSRTKLASKARQYEVLYKEYAHYLPLITELIVKESRKKSIDYLLIDCQAGYNMSSIVASEISDTAIIVSEADVISSEAIDNLIIHLGDKLPDEKYYLINKVDIRDSKNYSEMKNAFRSIGRLPPLPYDQKVRSAFGTRRIPVDLEKPSAFLFSLFNIFDYIFPELHDEIGDFREKQIGRLYESFEKKNLELIKRRESLINAISSNVRNKQNKEILYYVQNFFAPLLGLLGLFVFIWVIIGNLYGDLLKDTGITSLFILVAFVIVTGFSMMLYMRVQNPPMTQQEKESELLKKQLNNIERDIDELRSYLLAKSNEYYIEEEIDELLEFSDS